MRIVKGVDCMNGTNNNQEVANNMPNAVENKKVETVRYKYIVKDQNGKLITDYFDAVNKLDVESFLISQGYEIVEINEDKWAKQLGYGNVRKKKMTFKELSFFLTQLSTYIKAGIPLTDAIVILGKQAKSKKDKYLYKRIVFQLNKGLNFSQALEKQGDIFPKLLINMLKTSELTGNLTENLDDMAEYYRTSDENRKQIISALTYPSVILVVSIAILTFILLYVVPQFVGIYDQLGSELPMITKVVINVSNFVKDNIIMIALVAGLLIGVFALLYKSSASFRRFVQTVVMHIPVIKNLVIYKELVMFTKTFASLIRHGVFITDSMAILKKITNNEIYKVLINKAVNNLADGNGLAVAFKGHWAFPDIAYEMLLTGEKTGRMGQMMENVTRYYENEQKNLVTQLKSLVEPVMIILLAGIVGVIVLSVIVPMFSIYGNVL